MSVRRDPEASTTRRRRQHRRWRAVVAAAVLTAAAVIVPAGAAQAVPTLVTCTGTESVTYSPGITWTAASQSTTRDTDYPSCAHLVNLVLTTLSGTSSASFTATASCSSLLASGSGSRTITWSDTTSSVFGYSYVVNAVGGNVVIARTGTITSGRYAGATAVEEVTFLGLVAGLSACGSSPGITALSGPAVLTITDV